MINLVSDNSPSQVLDRLYLGTLQHARLEEKRSVRARRFESVINCSHERIEGLCDLLQTWLNFNDGDAVDPHRLLAGLARMRGHIDGGGSVLVCCHAGISRAPAVTAAYLYTCGYSWDSAMTLIECARPTVQPHFAVVQSVKKALGIDVQTLLRGGRR